jgi:hypothetical protein
VRERGKSVSSLREKVKKGNNQLESQEKAEIKPKGQTDHANCKPKNKATSVKLLIQ